MIHKCWLCKWENFRTIGGPCQSKNMLMHLWYGHRPLVEAIALLLMFVAFYFYICAAATFVK